MNERIRELLVQSGLLDYTKIVVPEHEKFAELIVRECVQVGGPEDSYTDEWFKAKADSVNKIREHFGVDE
jgi:hypothetical protein